MPNIMGKVFRDHHRRAYNAVHGTAQHTSCVPPKTRPAVHAAVEALKKFHCALTYIVDDIDKKRMTRTKTKKTLPKHIKELENLLKVAGVTPQNTRNTARNTPRNTSRNTRNTRKTAGNAPKKSSSKKTMKKKSLDPFVLFPKK